ncbi:MAG: Ig-like domain-containing protein [Clostridia bacterium]|nr:Ig-like domain-containing protein [Clostridia bacterium]
MRKISLLIVLSIIFAALLAFTSCTPEVNDPGKDGKVDFTVTVKDAFGNPMPNMVVNVLDGDKKVSVKMTNNEGKVSSSATGALDAKTYKVEVVDPMGAVYYFDKDAAVLEDGKEDITVVLYKTLSDDFAERLYLSDSGPDGTPAKLIRDGGFHVELAKGKNYFVFVPSVRGLYELKLDAKAEASMGYHGSPHFVQDNDLAASDDTSEVYKKDGALYFCIRSFNVGDSIYSSTRYVLIINASEACDATLSVSSDPDLPLSKEELPWSEIASEHKPTEFTLDRLDVDNFELTDFSITNKNLTVVYNSEDKFYHLGSEDGPVIYLRLKSASKYIASFFDITDTTSFSAYIYEDGELKAKRSYHNMILEYSEAADNDLGIYPLTEDLRRAVTDIGNAWGWFTPGGPNNILGTDATRVVAENAWLFAACYFDGEYYAGGETFPIKMSQSGKLAVSDSPVYLSTTTMGMTVTVADPDGIFKVTVGGVDYVAEGGTLSFTVPAETTFTVVTGSADGYAVFEYSAVYN